MSYSIIYKKRIEEGQRKLKYDKIYLYKKYFLLCGNCFWMASTLPNSSNMYTRRFIECPKCEDKLDKFLICSN